MQTKNIQKINISLTKKRRTNNTYNFILCNSSMHNCIKMYAKKYFPSSTVPLRVPYRLNFFIFYYTFFAIMHRTTIVQNKIISSICSCLFYVRLIIIGLVQGRCGQVGLPKAASATQFLSQRKKKKTILLRIVCTTVPDFKI